MFSKINNIRFNLTTPLVFAIFIIFATIVADISHQNIKKERIEQYLYNNGKQYEYMIKSNLAQNASAAEILAVALSRKFEQDDFAAFSKTTLKTLLLKHDNLNSAALFLKTTSPNYEEELLIFEDSLKFQQIHLKKASTGTVEEISANEFPNLFTKAEIEHAVSKEQIKILSPINLKQDGIDISVVPISAAIFKGKRFIGYFVLYANIDWQIDTYDEYDFEAFVSTGDNRVIVSKHDQIHISEELSKLCISCTDLLGNRGAKYNYFHENNYTTLCFPFDFKNSLKEWNICLRSYQKSFAGISIKRLAIWIIALFLLGIGGFVIIYSNNKIEKPLNDIFEKIDSIRTGNADTNDKKLSTKSHRFAKIENAIFELKNTLNKITETNKSIASGNYSSNIKIPEFTNELKRSTNNLYRSLETATNELSDIKKELHQAKKYTENLDKIAAVLKMYHKDIHDLSEQVVKTIVDLMDIEMGAMFLVKDNGEGKIVEQVVSYAYHETKLYEKKFKLGESLVGACAAEKRTVHLTKIPENYLKIISGLGETSPKSLLILPLEFENEVLGVLELGTLRDFDNNLISFAESAAQNIASTVSLAQNNIENTILLEQTKQQTKELEDSDRKMKEALSELKELQTATAKSEAAVRAKLEAMNNTLMIVEYTADGILLDANYKYLNTMHYSLDELKGNNVVEMLVHKKEDQEELLKVIKLVKSGNYFESIMRRHTKEGQEKWFKASYTPVFNDEGIVQNILFFGTDITKIKQSEIELKKSNILLQDKNDKLKDNE